jgi:hypothetical protein
MSNMAPNGDPSEKAMKSIAIIFVVLGAVICLAIIAQCLAYAEGARRYDQKYADRYEPLYLRAIGMPPNHPSVNAPVP